MMKKLKMVFVPHVILPWLFRKVVRCAMPAAGPAVVFDFSELEISNCF